MNEWHKEAAKAQIQKVLRNFMPIDVMVVPCKSRSVLGTHLTLFFIASELYHCPLFYFMFQEKKKKKTVNLFLTYHTSVQARNNVYEIMNIVSAVCKLIYGSLGNFTVHFHFDHNLKSGT